MAGIILYHSVEHFNIFTQEPIVHPLASDQTVADVLAWLLSGKMYGIFAMLFGLSFFIMNDNQQQKGKCFSGRFAWRMCLLFGFGIVNVAFYDGDILVRFRGCSACASSPLYLRSHESYQLSAPVRYRLCHLLRLWPCLLSLFGCYLCRHCGMWNGRLSMSLCPLLVQQSSSRTVRGPLEKTDMDLIVFI